MRPIKKALNKISLLAVLTAFTQVAMAQEAAPAAAAQPAAQPTSMVAILMLVIALVLAFVIWALGQVLYAMGRQALEKSRQNKAAITTIMMLGLSLLSLTSQAQDATAGAANDVAASASNYGGMTATTFWLFLAVIMTEVIVIFFIMFSIRRIQHELLPEEAAKQMTLRRWWSNLDEKLFTKAVPVEKEADVLLDHDYDGIRELDNALPPWWKYGFYITIGVAVVYLFNFHVMGYGKNPTEEYEAEMAKARVQAELYASTQVEKVDEKNIQMPDAAGLAKGKEIFTTSCWACHGKLGEGGAGPNLTDDYWIHKGSLNDIYHSIKVGYPDKGMQSWEKNFSPKEISYLAGYIKTLRGTNPPNGKAPQGDLFTESGAAPADSTAAPAKTDSAAAAKKLPADTAAKTTK